MIDIIVYGDTLPQAYHEALYKLNYFGEITPCPDYNTMQKELSLTMHILHPLEEPRISRLFIGGPEALEQYRREMLDGILDFEIAGGNWKYTYHQRMTAFPDKDTTIDQVAFVTKELRRNPASRRACITIRTAADMRLGNTDPACLQHIQYFIRNGKLDCSVLFRSNDACKATFMNAFALICLQERIAKELGVEVGSYTHRANSFHCYAKDFAMLEGYVKRTMANKYDTCYCYTGDWAEQMAEADEEIDRKVNILRGET